MENNNNNTPEQNENSDLSLTRKLDFLVEITQTILALGITSIMAYLAIKGMANENISNSFFLIVGFYFGKQFKDGAKKVGLSIYDIRKNGTKTF